MCTCYIIAFLVLQTKRFIDVDFNCLDTKINLQTWVILLDFLGLGAKVHDMETMQDPTAKPLQPDNTETGAVSDVVFAHAIISKQSVLF